MSKYLKEVKEYFGDRAEITFDKETQTYVVQQKNFDVKWKMMENTLTHMIEVHSCTLKELLWDFERVACDLPLEEFGTINGENNE